MSKLLLGIMAVCVWNSSALAQPPRDLGDQGGFNDRENSYGEEEGGRGGRRGGFGRMMGAPPNPMFQAIDADGDGVITSKELRRAIVALKKLDTDGDGNITMAEVRPQSGPGGPMGDPAQIITENDKNNDGKLQQEEIPPYLARMFEGADTNGDGAIDRDELAAQMEQMRGRMRGGRGNFEGDLQETVKQMMQLDRNGDGLLSTNEIPQQMMPMLQGADNNRDGVLDPQEVQSVAERMARSRGRRGGPRSDRQPQGQGQSQGQGQGSP